jgi:hypothetical protein
MIVSRYALLKHDMRVTYDPYEYESESFCFYTCALADILAAVALVDILAVVALVDILAVVALVDPCASVSLVALVDPCAVYISRPMRVTR